MRSLKEIQTTLEPIRTRGLFRSSEVDALSSELETNGIVVLPNLLNSEQLGAMQQAFEARLRRMRWNNFDGYHKTERFRHMIEDVLLLDQGFLDLALHPRVKQILSRYLGTNYEITEAKGWKSLPTKRDFHGWHGDSWYDQTGAPEIQDADTGQEAVVTEKLKYERGSGNIFLDVGFEKAEAENLKMRFDLMMRIEDWVKESGMTQAAAAKVLGLTQPRLNAMLKGKIGLFSLDALVNVASKAGLSVRLVVKKAA